MRLTVQPSTYHPEEKTVVLWSGPPREIWEAGTLNFSSAKLLKLTRAPIVEVGNWLPRASILPFWIPTLMKNFWE